MEKTTCGSHARAMTMKMMTINMTQVIGVISAKREETVGTKPSAKPTL
jgi:hypothetical protein